MLSSCRTIRYVPLPEQHSRDSVQMKTITKTQTKTIDRTHTLIQRGDTVFKTDSIYVEKLTDLEVHDTVTIALRDSVPIPIYLPSPSGEGSGVRLRFYRTCTLGFFLLLLALLAHIALRIYLRR